jgi:hypothetical protein
MSLPNAAAVATACWGGHDSTSPIERDVQRLNVLRRSALLGGGHEHTSQP